MSYTQFFSSIPQYYQTYISQKYGADGKRSHLVGFKGTQKVPRVELIDFLNVSKDNIALAPKRLWNVFPHQLRDVILGI